MSSKNIWRAQMLEIRSGLGPDKISQFNRDLCKNLSFIWAEGQSFAKNSLWAGYKSFRWEADPQEAIIGSSPYLRWAYPRIRPQDPMAEGQMEFYEPAATDAVWHKNSYGIWEPDPRTAEKINLDDCVGVLVPGIAFDRRGHRLGYGKGFYDRALSHFKGLKVGVAFSVQVTEEELPCDATDVKMDILVTNSEIIHLSVGARH